MTIVVDSNVIIAAFAARTGLCALVLDEAFRHHWIVLCEQIIEEVSRHLAGKINLSRATIANVVALLRAEARIVQPVLVPDEACRDPADLPILGTALAGDAEAVVTGDAHLLEVASFHGVRIVSPRQFWQRLRSGQW